MNNITFTSKVFMSLPACYFCKNDAELHFKGGDRDISLCLICANLFQRKIATAIDEGIDIEKQIAGQKIGISNK
jgi:hypothetical protein